MIRQIRTIRQIRQISPIRQIHMGQSISDSYCLAEHTNTGLCHVQQRSIARKNTGRSHVQSSDGSVYQET